MSRLLISLSVACTSSEYFLFVVVMMACLKQVKVNPNRKWAVYNMLTRKFIIWKFHLLYWFDTRHFEATRPARHAHQNFTKQGDKAPWQQQPFCSSPSLYWWITMIVDIRYAIVSYFIVVLIRKKWFICLLQLKMISGGRSSNQPTEKVIDLWNAVWSVSQWYIHSPISILTVGIT